MKRPGVLEYCRGGESVREVSRCDVDADAQIIEPVAEPAAERVLVETELQAGINREQLFQVKASFRCGLVLAPIGFVLMAVAVFMHWNAGADSMLGQFVMGGMLDAIAALLFIRSTRAQRGIDERLDEEHRDRNLAKAFEQCKSLPTGAARDALLIRLVLELSGVKNADENARAIDAAGRRRPSADARPKHQPQP